jgi:cytoskeletal protein CcmA (bactofilin family)
MGTTVVHEGEMAKLGNVDGDLVAEDHALIQASDGHKIVVSGKAVFEGSVELDCDFECGLLRSEEGLVRVNGNLSVNGLVDVEEGLYVKGDTRGDRIDVGGRFSAGGSLTARDVDVGGSLEVHGDLVAPRIDVGGSFEVHGAMKLEDLDVGGRVEAAGGEVTGRIDVGGNFQSSKPLRFNRIDTGGVVELAGGEGTEIEVGGRLRSAGDLKCDEVDVGGVIDIEGNLTVGRAKAGGRFRVSGNLTIGRKLEIGGIAEIGGYMSGADLEVEGSLSVAKAILTGEARMSGRVETSGGLKARVVELESGSRFIGPLVGEKVTVERGAVLQDVYCDELRVEGSAKLANVYAASVDLGDTCVVEKLTYSKEVREGRRVVYLNPPQKVESLPPFPL